jgi:hypothetical protein
LSHRPRKRFSQKCCPEWFFCRLCGVREVCTKAVDDIVDIQIVAAITLARSG